MRTPILAVLALALGAGCADQGANQSSASAGSSDVNKNKTTAMEPTVPELAAYAGHATYPSTQPANNEMKAAAIVTDSRTAVKIYNFGTEPIRSADIWVNGAFVQHISGIAPQSSVAVRTSQLYNTLGKDFASQGEPVSKVQVETQGTLYNVLGPASE